MKTVERGAELLDKVRPGWDEMIDLDTLDLSSCSACILGQIYMDAHPRTRNTAVAYDRERRELGIPEDKARNFGFVTWNYNAEFSNLTEAWRRLIERRRAS